MSEIDKRITQARLARGLNQSELARVLGVTPQSVQAWESGKNIPRNPKLRVIAIALGVTMAYLLGEEDGETPADEIRPLREDESNVSPALQEPSRRVREYPLISWVIAGEWAESADNYQPGDGEELIPGNAKAGAKGYWLEIKNDSMTPHFPEGTRILVQPEGFDLVIGKYYVALLYQPGGARETTFKQYTRDAGIEYLKPLNKEYRPIEVTDQVRIIGRVVDFDPPKGLL